MSHPSVLFLKHRFETGAIDVNFYNDHIFPAIKQGLIKDITPKDGAFSNDFTIRVWAKVEFPDGSMFWLTIRENTVKLDPRKPEYHVTVERATT